LKFFPKPKTGFSSLAVLALPFAMPAMSADIQEVIVTADFREAPEALYSGSLTVVGSNAISSRAAQHLDEILNIAPNVNFSAGASRGRFIQIRGIGERSQFVDPIDPSVGLTIDNINLSGVGNASTLFDVEQVEVLRGPQGTRFGAYGLAGMVNVTSKAPSDEFEGQISGGVGNYNSRELGAVISGPLADNLRGRLAVQQYLSDGHIDNIYLGRDDTAERDELTARARLDWQVSEDFSLDGTLFYVDVDNGYDNFSLDNNRKTLSDEPGRDAQETLAFGITANWTGNSAVSVQSTLALEKTDVSYSFDEDWTNTEICDGLACDSALWGFDWWYSSTDAYSRERDSVQLDIRMISGEDGKLFGHIDWVAGAYYFDKSEDLTRNFYDWDLDQPGLFASRYDNRNIALYGQLSAPLAEKLQLTVGARLERFSGDYHDILEVVATPGETLWGGDISLEYQANDNTMLYALVSHGFKAGGVNGDALGTARKNDFDDSVIDFLNTRLEFDTETVDNYEIGIKGDYFDGRWQLRAAAFWMERDDVQLKGWYNDGPLFVGYIDNGSSGTNRGVEIETVVALTPQLQIDASLGYLDTEIKDFYVLGDDELVNKSGRDQGHAPNYQYHVGANWTVVENLVARVEVEGRDRFYYSDSHDARSSAYNLVHASLAYSLGNVDLRLWGRNLTDKDYGVRGFYFANDPRVLYEDDQAYVQLGDPRTYGLTATYNF